jgi:YqjK-like protein
MNPRQQRLWIRRQELLRQSSDLRARLQAHALGLAPALRGADQAWAAGVWLREHPIVPAAVVFLLALRRPRGLLRWARRGWSAWQLARRLRSAWEARAAALGPLFGR